MGGGYREVVDNPIVVVFFFDDGLEGLHVVRLEVLHAEDVAELVLLHEKLHQGARDTAAAASARETMVIRLLKLVAPWCCLSRYGYKDVMGGATELGSVNDISGRGRGHCATYAA